MSEATNIEWADDTHNFWRGCTKVSPGCAHCYAEALVTTRLGGKWGKGAPRTLSKNFEAPLAWNKQPWVCDLCGTPSAGNRHDNGSCLNSQCEYHNGKHGSFHRRRVFSLSLGDWLDPEVDIAWLVRMLNVVRRCPSLTWQLVTKRPELFFLRLTSAMQWIGENHHQADEEQYDFLAGWIGGQQIPPNIWIIVSTENQEQLRRRVQYLAEIPGAIRGLSCEPLLGPLDLAVALLGADWVIVGGESGPGARPCDIEWIRSIVKQCKAAGVSCFVKQLGSFPVCDSLPDSGWGGEIIESSPDIENYKPAPLRLAPKHKKGGDPAEWPEDLRVREFPAEVVA